MKIIQIWEAVLAAPLDTQLGLLCTVLLMSLLTCISLLGQNPMRLFIHPIQLAGSALLLEVYDPWVHMSLYVLPALFLGALFFVLVPSSAPASSWHVRLPTHGGSISLPIKRGVSISGAAGSGKTYSCFLPIIRHCANKKMGGIIYDYKDGEMSEYLLSMYQEAELPVYPIYPYQPSKSYRVNPIAPAYLDSMNTVNALAQVFMSNLGVEMKGDNKFFLSAAESTLAAVIWRTKEDFPERCNLAYVTALMMRKSVEELADYIESDDTAAIMGKTFLDSMGADRQMAAIQSTISDSMRKIISPEMYWLLSGDDFSLKLNTEEDRGILLLINHPSYREVYNPFLATLFQSTIMQMSVRKRLPSAIIIDEGSTIKLNDAANIPATLRSYDIATVFGLQDMVQGEILYGEKPFKALLTNLSTVMVGKTNDPNTSGHYVKLVEEIKKKQTSYTRGKQQSSTVSKKEEKKIKQHEFHQLQTGEFILFNQSGRSRKVRIKAGGYEKTPLPVIREVSPRDIQRHFNRILEEVQEMY